MLRGNQPTTGSRAASLRVRRPPRRDPETGAGRGTLWRTRSRHASTIRVQLSLPPLPFATPPSFARVSVLAGSARKDYGTHMARESSARAHRRSHDQTCLHLVVDFAAVGLARRFLVPVTTRERAQLSIGSHVVLLGDSVEPVEALVQGFDEPSYVEVELLDPS